MGCGRREERLAELREQFGGDHLFGVCDTADDVAMFDEQKTINTLNLTLSKGKTVSGALDLAKAAKSKGWGIVVSSETTTPETDDSFAAHFAVGVRAGQFKAGGLCGAEHLAKYNELLRISSDPANPPAFIAGDFRAACCSDASHRLNGP